MTDQDSPPPPTGAFPFMSSHLGLGRGMSFLNRSPFSLVGGPTVAGPLKPIGATPFFKNLLNFQPPESTKEETESPAVTTPPAPESVPESARDSADETVTISEKIVLVIEDVAPQEVAISAETAISETVSDTTTDSNTAALETVTVETIVEEVVVAPNAAPAESRMLVADAVFTDDSLDAPVTPDTILALPNKAFSSDPTESTVEVVIAAPAPARERDLPSPATIVIAAPALKVLVIDITFSDDSLHAPVDSATILALPNKVSSGTQVINDEPAVEEVVVEEGVIEELVSVVTPTPGSESTPAATLTPAPAPAPVLAAAALTIDATWMDASLNAPVTPSSILALPNGMPSTLAEQVTIVAEEASIATEDAPVVEFLAEEEVTAAPATEVLVIDSIWMDSSLDAPVTPGAILALPEKTFGTKSVVPLVEVVEVVESVSEVTLPEIAPELSTTEANNAPVSPQRIPVLSDGPLLSTPEIPAAPAFPGLTPSRQTFLPRNLSDMIEVDHIEDISAFSRNTSFNASLLSRSVSSNLISVDHIEDVAPASRTVSSNQITLDHIEDIPATANPTSPVSATSDPALPSESSSFGAESELCLSKEDVLDNETEDSDLESSSDEALEIVKSKKKAAVVAVIEALVWPVIYEDDFDGSVSSFVDSKEIDWENKLALDMSWMIPAPKKTVEEKAKDNEEAVKPEERALVLAAERLTLSTSNQTA